MGKGCKGSVALEERTRATTGGCPYIQKERGGSLSVRQPKGWGMVIGGDSSAAAALRPGIIIGRNSPEVSPAAARLLPLCERLI